MSTLTVPAETPLTTDATDRQRTLRWLESQLHKHPQSDSCYYARSSHSRHANLVEMLTRTTRIKRSDGPPGFFSIQRRYAFPLYLQSKSAPTPANLEWDQLGHMQAVTFHVVYLFSSVFDQVRFMDGQRFGCSTHRPSWGMHATFVDLLDGDTRVAFGTDPQRFAQEPEIVHLSGIWEQKKGEDDKGIDWHSLLRSLDEARRSLVDRTKLLCQ